MTDQKCSKLCDALKVATWSRLPQMSTDIFCLISTLWTTLALSSAHCFYICKVLHSQHRHTDFNHRSPPVPRTRLCHQLLQWTDSKTLQNSELATRLCKFLSKRPPPTFYLDVFQGFFLSPPKKQLFHLEMCGASAAKSAECEFITVMSEEKMFPFYNSTEHPLAAWSGCFSVVVQAVFHVVKPLNSKW